MPRKITPADTDYIIDEYRSGRSAQDIASDFGVSVPTITSRLKKANVSIRGNVSAIDPTEVIRLYRSGLNSSEVGKKLGCASGPILRVLKKFKEPLRPKATDQVTMSDAAIQKAKSIYETGVGLSALAKEVGVSPTVIRRVFADCGVEIRGRSAQQKARMDRASAEERQRLSSAAHDAVRGRKRTVEELSKAAKTRERIQSHTSHYERAIVAGLISKGIPAVCQKAIGPYNCDIAVDGVAVEIFGGGWHWHGAHANRAEKRLRYILNSGWHCLMVHIDTRAAPMRVGITDYIASHINDLSRNPPATCQYWVVRGAGDLLAAGCADDDKVSIETMFASARDPVTGRYKRIRR